MGNERTYRRRVEKNAKQKAVDERRARILAHRHKSAALSRAISQAARERGGQRNDNV